MWLAGFDPGGKSSFGWCVAEATEDLPLTIRQIGVASGAAEAVDCARNAIPSGSTIAAAGIDSPLFWRLDGDRAADGLVRTEINNLGAPTAWGTVQHVNSLRGACLVQGMLAAVLLRKNFSSIEITEAHPKAMLWLLGVATKRQSAGSVTMREISKYVADGREDLSEHERDAALATLGAWAMKLRRSDWEDLYLREGEGNTFCPVSPVAYWMPIISDDSCDPPDAEDSPE